MEKVLLASLLLFLGSHSLAQVADPVRFTKERIGAEQRGDTNEIVRLLKASAGPEGMAGLLERFESEKQWLEFIESYYGSGNRWNTDKLWISSDIEEARKTAEFSFFPDRKLRPEYLVVFFTDGKISAYQLFEKVSEGWLAISHADRKEEIFEDN